MPKNKNALVRYQALDKCFSNPGKRYFIEDLLEACNAAILEFEPEASGIKKRQLFDDIRFMESEQGWSIPLDKSKEGRRVYYRYEDASFSINKQPINLLETEQLKSALLVLNRFKGLPQFEWINELLPKIDQSFKLTTNDKPIIGFQNNAFLKGIEHITPLFSAVKNEQALQIKYQSFKHDTATTLTFHPYYLKQYNNRWFVFGKQDSYTSLTNLALDRIEEIKDTSVKYDASLQTDFEEYFEDVIGVTKPIDAELTTITLLAKPGLAPYIKTKPLHGSQKKVSETPEGYTFSLKVIPNYELAKLILSYGEALKVLSPVDFQEKILSEIKQNQLNYN